MREERRIGRKNSPFQEGESNVGFAERKGGKREQSRKKKEGLLEARLSDETRSCSGAGKKVAF